MPIKPRKGESQSDFMRRCVPEMIGTGADKRPQEQAVAICLDIWRGAHGGKKPKQDVSPDDDETHSEFIDRCTGEGLDESECEDIWDESRGDPPLTLRTHSEQANGSGMEFILSDESVDRMGDVIIASGWQLDNFKRNSIALFNHNPNAPIGTWKNVRVENKQLRGHLELAPEGTSSRIDEIRRLVHAGVLKAVSVGFKPIKRERITRDPKDPDSDFLGVRFLEQELVETSLVSVPANQNALAVARSLSISRETMKLVFAEQGDNSEGHVHRSLHAEQGTIINKRTKTMPALSQSIVESQGRINVLTDALKEHLETQDGSDAAIDKTNELNAKIKHERKNLDSLLESERNLGESVQQQQQQQGDVEPYTMRMPVRQINSPTPAQRVFAEPAKQSRPGDLIWKCLTALVKLQGDKYRKATSYLDALRDTVGENEKAKTIFDVMIGKAASAPAITTQAGWAQELVRTEYGAFMDALQPDHVFARLAAKGQAFTFGTNGIISIPYRVSTPTIAGSFVGEGAPIPVRQGAFNALTLTPKKMAVITTLSREISEHSDPAIEGILRQAIVDDTAVAIDTVLMDANPATTIRPAGLRNALATLTPTAGGGFSAVVGDIKAMVGALLTATLGKIRSPVWLMGADSVLALRLISFPTGEWAFRDEIDAGNLAGYPVIVSSSVTADTVYLVDAYDFVTAGETAPRFDISDQATVHMEDTTPLAISAPGTPATVAAPVRSFWQTDTIGIRMLMGMNWAFRRTGMIVYTTGVTWN